VAREAGLCVAALAAEGGDALEEARLALELQGGEAAR
jgi:hypothetical protein